ncbi:hypothetical protein CYMTET_44808 [Cymbomonas tetramitiformis]|uniref:Tyr recombinase domain-containing protein n=1 Tax=Cymbomonas tetramitiformis TaxID=36881 RepID=A0AAE0C0Q3_9CHLO|nr:hypothetical protein CYMTET_44808 [Cymbomonas tetramitiformis]
MLTAFFLFFRKDNVSVEKADAWNLRGHLVRSDVFFPGWDEGGRQLPNLGRDRLLFYIEDAKGRLKPLTHSVFVAGYRKLAARAGLDPAAFSGHSFRRGGGTAAFKLQIQDALIQAHGDWASDCYKLYCDMDSAQQLILPSPMATGAAAATRAFEIAA